MFQLKSYTDISGTESKYMMHGNSKDEAEAWINQCQHYMQTLLSQASLAFAVVCEAQLGRNLYCLLALQTNQ
jgi:hypothetical protein